MPVASSCPTPTVLDRLTPITTAQQAVDLRTYLAAVPDPRHRRGVRHPLTAILAITAVAVAAGARSFTAIAEWAADAPQHILAALGARLGPRHARYQAPDETTLRRVTQRLDGDQVDAAITAWLTNQHHNTNTNMDASAGDRSLPPAAIAVDGKSIRDTYTRAGGAGVHLLAAFTHTTGTTTGTVPAQRQVTIGTSEITWFPALLDPIDLTNTVVTADALHTTRNHARYLRSRGADYVFTVKENQHRLYHQLDSLPWHEAPTLAFTNRGHGRSEKRTIQVLPLGNYLGFPRITFPHATHAFLIERYVTHHTTDQTSAHAALGITSLTGHAAHPAQIHHYVRGHWQIENRLHWIRDTTYREDHSRVRTGTAPRIMASLRNLAISALPRHDTPTHPPRHQILKGHNFTGTLPSEGGGRVVGS